MFRGFTTILCLGDGNKFFFNLGFQSFQLDDLFFVLLKLENIISPKMMAVWFINPIINSGLWQNLQNCDKYFEKVLSDQNLIGLCVG